VVWLHGNGCAMHVLRQCLETIDHTLRQRIYPVVGFDGRDVIRISARFAGPFKYNVE
jgi:hypothetical protein